MTDNFPKTINFISDDTECEFVEEIINKKLKDRFSTFKYTKANFFLNREVVLSFAQINKLIGDRLVEVKY